MNRIFVSRLFVALGLHGQPWRYSRRMLKKCLVVLFVVFSASPSWAQEAPDAFILRVTGETLQIVQSDPALKSGDMGRISEVVEQKVMPHLNFPRMTAAAVGPAWRQTSPEQRQRLQDEFKLLLISTYAGSLARAKDLKVVVKPLRGAANEGEVLVRTELRGGTEPVPIDYRLEKSPDSGSGWRIYNLNVAGVWLVDTYRTQFAQEINARGIEGLISSLSARNQSRSSQ